MFEIIKWNERDKTILFDSLTSLKDYVRSVYGYNGKIKDNTFLSLTNEGTRRISGLREDYIRIYKDTITTLCATPLRDKCRVYELKEFTNKSGFVWYANITLLSKGGENG